MSKTLDNKAAALQRTLEQRRARIKELTLTVSALRTQLALLSPDMSGGRYCGIYILMNEGEPVYVGQSINVFGRINSHRAASSLTGVFDEVRIVWCNVEDLDLTERRLIGELQPSRNIAGTKQVYHGRGSRSSPTPSQVYGPEFCSQHLGALA